MLLLELGREDLNILADVLRNDVSDLGREISHTDRLDYRSVLKQRRAVLERVIQSIEGELFPDRTGSSPPVPPPH